MPMSYRVLWTADASHTRGYRDRQLLANERGAALYLELHYNAKVGDRPGMQDNPASVVVASNASATSRGIARDLAQKSAKYWGFPSLPGGVAEVGYGGRGYYNLVYTKMPAVLTELFWVSEEEHVAIINDPEGREKLAAIITETIAAWIPDGSLIAISPGHLFKGTGDKGAPVAGMPGRWEAELALLLAHEVARQLQGDNGGCPCPHCGKLLNVR